MAIDQRLDDLVWELSLLCGPPFLRKILECTGHHAFDMTRESRVRLGWIHVLLDDACCCGIKLKQPRLAAGRDQALIEPEGKVVVLNCCAAIARPFRFLIDRVRPPFWRSGKSGNAGTRQSRIHAMKLNYYADTDSLYITSRNR